MIAVRGHSVVEPQPKERGCVQSTSRSTLDTPCALRLGLRPQPRSGESSQRAKIRTEGSAEAAKMPEARAIGMVGVFGGPAISLQNRDNSAGSLWEDRSVKAGRRTGAPKTMMEDGGSKMAGDPGYLPSSILAAVLSTL